jgi:uncharacterized protein (DUF1501 family)
MAYNRRSFLKYLAGAISAPAWFPRFTFASSAAKAAAQTDTLICVFLRGGADGLNIVVPYGEQRYYDNRPTLAVAEPGSSQYSALEIDGFFGFHPSLAPLKELFDDGVFAPVIATGSHDDTHSHFDAMEFMESGVPGDKSVNTGWLARHLDVMRSANDSAFRALAIGYEVPSSLRGPVPATALNSIEEFHLEIYEAEAEQFQQTLQALYSGTSFVDVQALQTLDAVNSLAESGASGFQPENGAAYPDGSYFAAGLQEIAKIIKADVGLEAACVDYGNWDTHEGQGGAGPEGWMSSNLNDLARSLQAFYQDMGDRMNRVTVVVMSEFGRRIDENGSAGTDHGHGGVFFVLGGKVRGGKVYGQWPGLAPGDLYGPGDLAITTDYRTILKEILRKRMGNKKVGKVFPKYKAEAELGIVSKG